MNNFDFLYNGTNINKNKLKKEWIMKNKPLFFNILSEFEKELNIEIDIFSRLLYHYKNSIIDYPICDYCGGQNKRFSGFESGYKNGCSRHCAILLTRPKSNETRKINNLEKYGVEHTTQLEFVKDKMKNTNLEKYGFNHASQNEAIKNKIFETNLEKYGHKLPLQNVDIKNKMIDEFIKKHGVSNPINLDSVKNKIKKNSMEKYGVEWHISSDIIKNKIKEKINNSNYENIKINYKDVENLELKSLSDNIALFYCTKCEKEFKIQTSLLYQRYVKNKIEICTNCNPLNNRTSGGHLELIDFLNYLGITNILINDRKIISPYELDIYLPDYNLAIEFNGIYWHSDIYKDKNSHVSKSDMCSKSGLQLIYIWEDDWKYKSKIIKSIISNRLGKSIINIGARQCEILNVSDIESKVFLNDNHIQGWCISKFRYGLYYKGNLVSILTISKGRKNLNSESDVYEITRFCNQLNTNVSGSISRLWKYFISKNLPKKVISYCDNDLYLGKSYLILGMNLSSFSTNYWWSDGEKRHNRWNFRKDKLVREGYDKNMTESEIMNNRGWYKCYGSGNKKFILNLN